MPETVRKRFVDIGLFLNNHNLGEHILLRRGYAIFPASARRDDCVNLIPARARPLAKWGRGHRWYEPAVRQG